MKFSQNKRNQTTLFFLGQAGNGKSTMSTKVNRQLAEMQGIEFNKEWINKASKGMRGVTTEIQAKEIGKYLTVDTPGLNDSDQKLNQEILWHKMVDYLNNGQISREGLSCFVHMVMVPASGRMSQEAVLPALNLIQILGLLNNNFASAPKLFVVFSDFSRIPGSADEVSDISFE